jgi:hypothetical protein
MKKLFFVLFMLLMPLLASADPVEIDGIYYNLIEKAGQAEVTSNPNKYTGSVVIPEEIEYEDKKYRVSSIGKYAFSECTNLTSINIANSVTSIHEWAFNNCRGLTSIIIPNSTTSIGMYAFYYCRGLTSVTIPNSVTSISKGAFSGCEFMTSVYITDIAAWCNIIFGDYDSNPLYYAHHLYFNGEEIKDLTIPESVTSIGMYAFYDCEGLTSVTIPSSVTSIGMYAFYDCEGLTSVTIPSSVTSIGDTAFYGCSSLTSITVPNGVTSIGKFTFSKCTSLTSVTIPNSVTSIGSYTFSNCSGLNSVFIPNSVTSIGDGAFWDCNGLISATIGSGVKTIGSLVFGSCKELKDIYCLAENVPNTHTSAFIDSYPEYMALHVPANSLDAYKTTAPWSSFGDIIALDDASGINTISKDSVISHIYDMQGNRLDNPQKGVNIIRMKDGKTKKIIVK